MSRGGDFWGRRRAAVAAEAEAEQAVLEAQTLADEHAALEELSDEEVLAALNLPDPDSLKLGDDFTAFMSKAVPDALRRRALRTLWRSNPVLANVDMLVDYGEDFTDSAMVVENLQTAYQVGKGMLKHVEEVARKAAEAETVAEEVEETPEIEAPEEEVVIAAVAQGEPLATEDDGVEREVEVADAEEDEVIMTPAPRRMKFRVEETA
ncbi:DUF3306 domain containing protein [Sulfitobacter noctilucicola]|uniref:DUF3306 domain-containing protein n=1 Tax=Sulfitobacter noctilucicola TaxID=1342301 RepID=A0A7W6Q5A3_9RHOB|nr:DUF3306 domain-containing protein [Sulfitobacter noctilucicola]KIN70164.1 DUF3306 domain containing protein [Sulfitobacter noctilucicola]MBB4176165.1 hypothetical protein [Sulfitobacter noctilucicola]